MLRLEVNNGKESDNIEKNGKTRIIQSEESRHYNVSILINLQDVIKRR